MIIHNNQDVGISICFWVSGVKVGFGKIYPEFNQNKIILYDFCNFWVIKRGTEEQIEKGKGIMEYNLNPKIKKDDWYFEDSQLYFIENIKKITAHNCCVKNINLKQIPQILNFKIPIDLTDKQPLELEQLKNFKRVKRDVTNAIIYTNLFLMSKKFSEIKNKYEDDYSQDETLQVISKTILEGPKREISSDDDDSS